MENISTSPYLEYSWVIILVLGWIFKNHIFVTPAELEKAKAEMKGVIETKLEKAQTSLRDDMKEIKEDIRAIREFLMLHGGEK